MKEPTEQITVPISIGDRLRARQKDHTSLAGVIEELLDRVEYPYLLQQARKDAKEYQVKHIRKGVDVKTGWLWETTARLYPRFPYQFNELFGVHQAFPSPIDGIAFPGLSTDDIVSVDLCDYQLGQYLNGKHKRQVRQCVKDGRVNFKLLHPKDMGISIPERG